MDKAKVVEALNILIQEQSFLRRTKQIMEMVDDWYDTPRVYAGRLLGLNVLIDIGLDNKESLEKLFALAKDKRKAIPSQKKVDYQRSMMRERRDRLLKAVKLEELVRGSAMAVPERNAYMSAKQKEWMEKRNAHVQSKGTLSWKERNAAAGEYWDALDAELDKDLAEAEKVLDREPVKRKRTVKVEREYGTAIEAAMKQAKEKV